MRTEFGPCIHGHFSGYSGMRTKSAAEKVPILLHKDLCFLRMTAETGLLVKELPWPTSSLSAARFHAHPACKQRGSPRNLLVR